MKALSREDNDWQQEEDDDAAEIEEKQDEVHVEQSPG